MQQVHWRVKWVITRRSRQTKSPQSLTFFFFFLNDHLRVQRAASIPHATKICFPFQAGLIRSTTSHTLFSLSVRCPKGNTHISGVMTRQTRWSCGAPLQDEGRSQGCHFYYVRKSDLLWVQFSAMVTPLETAVPEKNFSMMMWWTSWQTYKKPFHCLFISSTSRADFFCVLSYNVSKYCVKGMIAL